MGLFRFANKNDIFLMITGTISALLMGTAGTICSYITEICLIPSKVRPRPLIKPKKPCFYTFILELELDSCRLSCLRLGCSQDRVKSSNAENNTSEVC